MPWKLRQTGRYYYRSIRDGDRVRTEYVGAGPAAELIAAADRLESLERAQAAEAWRAERAALDAEDLARAARFGVVEAVVRGALEAAGFRRHKRGDWRRSRMRNEPSTPGPPRPAPPAPIAEIED